MVRLHTGRAVEEDLATVQRVMKSINIPNLLFSIIVNQVSANTCGKLVKEEPQFDENALFGVKKIDELDEEANTIVLLPQELHAFVDEATPIVISLSEDVSEISSQDDRRHEANRALATKRLHDVIDAQIKAAEDMRAEYKRAAEAIKAEFERVAKVTKAEHDNAIKDQRELYNKPQQALIATRLDAARTKADQLKLEYSNGASVKFIIANQTQFIMTRKELYIERGKTLGDTHALPGHHRCK